MRYLIAALSMILSAATAAADWEQVTSGIAKQEKAGFGGICGVLVDRATGHLYLNISDKGMYRSTDHGKSWAVFGAPFKGRTEWPGCLAFDPTGKSDKFIAALVYGAPILLGSPKGDAWTMLDKKSVHVDWCAVDWSDPALKFMMAMKHETGGVLLVSHDGGKTFAEKGKGFAAAWVFDNKTAVAAEMKSKDRPKPGLIRTEDAGATWTPCGDYRTEALPRWRDGTLHWLVEGALLTTADQGKTWKKAGDLKDAKYGPVFGKDAKTLFALTKAGVVESADAGATWSTPIPLPKELKGWSPLTWLEYDPVRDAIYVVKMGSELWRWDRGAK